MQRAVLLFSLCLACSRGPSQPTSPETGLADAGVGVVSPIPAGFRAVTPVLVVSDVAAALDWYGTALEARPIMTLADAEGLVMHAELDIGDTRLMLGAEDPDHDVLAPDSLGGSNVSLYMYVEDVDAAFEKAVNFGAEPRMVPTDMVWGDRVAELTDPAGHRWNLATRMQDLSAEQLADAAKQLGEALAAGEAPPVVTLERTAIDWQPAGHTTVIPTLAIEGGIGALSFYEHAFAAKVLEELPMPDGKTLLHATVQIGDSILMLHSPLQADPELDSAVELGGTAVRFHHYVESVEPAWQRAVNSGATAVSKPIETFWGDRVGELLDPSGVPWSIATHVRDVPPEQLAARFAQD
jgi:PhnB protein